MGDNRNNSTDSRTESVGNIHGDDKAPYCSSYTLIVSIRCLSRSSASSRLAAVSASFRTPARSSREYSFTILQATYEAMREAIGRLACKPDILLNDAVTIPRVSIPQVPIVKGDAKSISIGAASILGQPDLHLIAVPGDDLAADGLSRHQRTDLAVHQLREIRATAARSIWRRCGNTALRPYTEGASSGTLSEHVV